MNKAFFTKIETTILANLKNAKTSIKIAVAWFSNPVFYNLLLEKMKDGVQIQIILADDIANFRNPKINFQKIIDFNGSIKISRFPRLMHHKFCLIDDRLLITGSYNWTINAEQRNLENIIVSLDMNLVQTFEKEFLQLIEKTDEVKNIEKMEFKEYANDWGNDNSNLKLNLNHIEAEASQNGEGDIDEEDNNIDEEDDDIDEDIWNLYGEAEQLYFQAKYSDALNLTDSILQQISDFSLVYELISLIHWRKKDSTKQIEFATKAIECDNLNYDAYNSLGIGYAGKGNASKSIENYAICIKAKPKNYIYYWNRGLSYQNLAEDSSFPAKLKPQYKQKAEDDFRKTIQLTNEVESQNTTNYRLYECRGCAKFQLDKMASAKQDLQTALSLYQNAQKKEQDIHILRDIQLRLKLIKKYY
jgi:hypothetical protein